MGFFYISYGMMSSWKGRGIERVEPATAVVDDFVMISDSQCQSRRCTDARTTMSQPLTPTKSQNQETPRKTKQRLTKNTTGEPYSSAIMP